MKKLYKISIIFLIEWQVERDAIYTWQKINDEWEINTVKVLNEKSSLSKKVKFYKSSNQFKRGKTENL